MNRLEGNTTGFFIINKRKIIKINTTIIRVIHSLITNTLIFIHPSISSSKMDLVSSTLDKYLKNRFNGNGLERSSSNGLTQIETNDNDCNSPVIQKISISNSQPCCAALRRDLQFLATGFENSLIYLWNFKKNSSNNDEGDDNITYGNDKLNINSVSTLLAHSGSVYGIEFVNNNDLMLSCSEDTTIRLWCLNKKCNLIIYRGHNYPIWTLDVGPQGNLFVSASMDATARVWKLDRITPIRILCGHDEDVECVKFHPNEKYIATGSSDATVRLWSVSDGKVMRLMVGHQEPIISLSFLPNGKFLASASRDGVIKVWNLATNLVTTELSVPPSYTISFSPEQKFVASCGVDNVLSLWQLDDAKLIERKKLNLQRSKLIQSHFHRDNKLFLIAHVVTSTKEENHIDKNK